MYGAKLSMVFRCRGGEEVYVLNTKFHLLTHLLVYLQFYNMCQPNKTELNTTVHKSEHYNYNGSVLGET